MTLDVGVSSDGTDPRPGSANVASEQQQVGKHLDVLNAEPMLGEAHAIDGDDRPCSRVLRGRGLQVLAPEPGLLLQRCPVAVAHEGRELLEGMRVLVNECDVKNAFRPIGDRTVIRFDQRLADAREGRKISTGADLVVLSTDAGAAATQHLEGRLGIDELDQPRFLQRIESDDRDVAAPRVLQLVQHPGAVRSDILPEEEDAIGLLEILQRHRADTDTDCLRQRHGSALVAHVGAVGQVVAAIHPGEQLVHVGGFQRCAPRGVEDDVRGSLCAHFRRDLRKRILPGALQIPVSIGVPAHGCREAALLLEIVVGPGPELADRVLQEKLGRRAPRSQFPRRGFRSVLTKLERVRLRGLAPRAAHARKAIGLVLMDQDAGAFDDHLLAAQYRAQRFHGSPAAGGAIVPIKANVIGHGTSMRNGRALSGRRFRLP